MFGICIFFLFPSIESDSGCCNVLGGLNMCTDLVQRGSQAVFHISHDTVSLFYVTWSLVYFPQLYDCFVTCDFRLKSCCYGSYILQRC